MRIYKLFVLLLVYIFSSTNIIGAQEARQPIANIKELVSENYGSIRDSYFAPGGRDIVVHIQDLHCNYDAQISIYHIIDELINKYGLNLVLVEGSVGQLDTKQAFSQCTSDKTREMVAKYFVKKGKVDGAALAHIMNKEGFLFWGADDERLYKNNVEAYRSYLKTKDKNAIYHNNMKAIIESFKEKVYSAELKELDSKIKGYKKEELEFADYVRYLDSLIEKYGLQKANSLNFVKLLDTLKKEKDIDFVEVDNQRSEYIDKLSKELKDKKLSELLDKSLYFKTGKISALEFYAYLESVSQENKTDMAKDFPQLARYIEYIKLYSDIENIKLFKEMDAIEVAIKEKLFKNDIQRKADRLSHTLDVLNDLFNLKLTKDTLQYYRDHRKEFQTSYIINFISEHAPKYSISYKLDPAFREVDASLPSLEKFYMLAEERDNVLVFNTLNKMNKENANLAVLVSGGFHTDGITRLLKDKNISYVVVTPKVEKLQVDNPYNSVLLGEKTEEEQLLIDIGKTIKQ